ncbi:putative Mg2+ transporter-C (MgtC) family protein [Peribacillus deserti]|uniref:Mg2+ transporter-C (MgtC) family protein n=1 Tax=Peribacillus deserti TaxID=673318 RepID=A0ABS2QQW8_9BACI|nr:MgtC/SapB family protein [Peribacillus deserti]MBM7694631.1 putative Mg2+ transporter-C (MgtC) family protein [Peribacillus deserti]
MDLTLDENIFIKLSFAAILGLIIGLEREIKRKPLGLKTCLVISIVSCLLTAVSIESAYFFPGDGQVNITMDPLRLAAQIVSGIGFLGAGVILRRGNDTVTGLTTAAMIWGAAGIGIAVGAGYYWESTAGVIMLMLSVEFIPYLMHFIGPKQLREKEILLRLTVSEQKEIESIIAQIKKEEIEIKNVRIKDLNNEEYLVQLKVTVNQKRTTTNVYYSVSKVTGIRAVEIEGL